MKKKTLRTAAVVLSLIMSVSSVNVMGQVEMSSKTTTDDTKNAVVELEDLIKDMEDAKNEISDLEDAIKIDQDAIDQTKDQITEAEKDLSDKKEEAKDAEENVSDAAQDVLDAENKLNADKSHLDELKDQLSSSEKTEADAKKELADAEQDLKDNKDSYQQGLMDAAGSALAGKNEADKNAAEAQKKADEAKDKLADGSYGFFEWMGSTEITDYDEYSYRKKSSALDALLNPYYSNYDDNFNIPGKGKENDATSITNMLKALDYIDMCNALRKGEGLNELKVSLTLLGVAQSNANFISYHFEHAGGMGAENIAIGGKDPFQGWYYIEKEDPDYFGTDGHYKNIIDPSATSTGFGVFYNEWGVAHYSQVFGGSDDAYTTAELRILIQQYIDYMTGGADKNLEDAKKTQEEAEKLYNAIVKELNDLGVDTSSITPADISGVSLDQLLKDTKIAYENTSALKTAYTQSKAVYDTAKTAYDTAAKNLSDLKAEIASQESLVKQDEAVLIEAKAKKAAAETLYNRLSQECADLESSLIGLKEKLADEELKLSKDEAALATAKQKLAQAEEKYDARNIFTDVEKGSYYYDAVLWCVTKNITNGTTPNTFSPKDDCTRAQVVMFLWRAAGSPLVSIDENPFIDVHKGSHFYNAIIWAYQKNITQGYTDGTFRPNEPVRRAEYVTFQYRAAGSPEIETTVNPFTDVTSSFKNFEKAILWAYENGISTGKTATTFQPNLNCSRANVVAFLYRGRLL